MDHEVTLERLELATRGPDGTKDMGAALARLLQPDDVLALVGTLGAGKTCFVKGLARGLGVEDDRTVTSASFVLMKRYEGRLTLYHFDAYRLQDAAQMEEIGAGETMRSGGVTVIEWADRIAECLPEKYFRIEIMVSGMEDRRFSLTPAGEGPSRRMSDIAGALADWRVEPETS